MGVAPQVDVHHRGAQLVDLVAYVLVVTTLVYAPVTVLAAVLEWGVGSLVQYGFVMGFLMFGYGTYLLWPSRAEEFGTDGDPEAASNGPSPDGDESEQSPLQRAIIRWVPMGTLEEPNVDPLTAGTKLFVASLAVLAVSYLLESPPV